MNVVVSIDPGAAHFRGAALVVTIVGELETVTDAVRFIGGVLENVGASTVTVLSESVNQEPMIQDAVQHAVRHVPGLRFRGRR